jgi:hypothetical protein
MTKWKLAVQLVVVEVQVSHLQEIVEIGTPPVKALNERNNSHTVQPRKLGRNGPRKLVVPQTQFSALPHEPQFLCCPACRSGTRTIASTRTNLPFPLACSLCIRLSLKSMYSKLLSRPLNSGGMVPYMRLERFNPTMGMSSYRVTMTPSTSYGWTLYSVPTTHLVGQPVTSASNPDWAPSYCSSSATGAWCTGDGLKLRGRRCNHGQGSAGESSDHWSNPAVSMYEIHLQRAASGA